MWNRITNQVPSDGSIVWIRYPDYFGMPVTAQYNLTTQTFTTLVTNLTIPAYLAIRWKYFSAMSKIYKATLTQGGSDAPIPLVLYNTLGIIVWSYNGAGIYTGTLAGAFPNSSKVLNFMTADTNGNKAAVVWNDANSIQVITRNTSNTPADGILSDSSLYLEVFS